MLIIENDEMSAAPATFVAARSGRRAAMAVLPSGFGDSKLPDGPRSTFSFAGYGKLKCWRPQRVEAYLRSARSC